MLVVAVPFSEKGASELPQLLVELRGAFGDVVEANRHEHPSPHGALIVGRGSVDAERRETAATIAGRKDTVVLEGPPSTSVHGISSQYAIARRSLSVVLAHYRESTGMVPLAAAAFDTMLLSTPRPGQFEFVRKVCGPLLALREELATAYVDTIWAILASGGSAALPSRALFLHRHGVAYRRRRISALVGCDPADPRSRANFLVALRLLQLRGDAFPPPGDPKWLGARRD